MSSNVLALIELYQRLSLTPIPLKQRSKVPLVKWQDGWNPTADVLGHWLAKPGTNWGVRCGEKLAVLDFDSDDSFHSFLEAHPEANSWPRVKTGRGFHLWVRPKKPIRSQRLNAIEIKGVGSYVVAPPSIHPSGVPYAFEVVPDGSLPDLDLEALLGFDQTGLSPVASPKAIEQLAPSDFALRYGKSSYPESLCRLATKVLTRSDGRVKKLVSLRCWKWHCPKCTPLLKRYWQQKFRGLAFRFILRLPTVDKPTRFLRSLGKPRYVHVVANGESWLFLMDGEAEPVWAEARRVGYELIAGDIAGDPIPEEVAECLEKALCREEEPLNTRRKITHSKSLMKREGQGREGRESKPQTDCGEGRNKGSGEADHCEKQQTWESEVLMKPIDAGG